MLLFRPAATSSSISGGKYILDETTVDLYLAENLVPHLSRGNNDSWHMKWNRTGAMEIRTTLR